MSAQAIIDELLEYFEDRADASCEPGDDRFRGNKEMSLLQEVQKLAICFSDGNRNMTEALRHIRVLANPPRPLLHQLEQARAFLQRMEREDARA